MQTHAVELGYFAHPDEGAHPGVVLIHDVWGLAEHTRDLAGRLAEAGFAALAVDLYRREGEPKIRDPGAWMRALSDPQVLSDVRALEAGLEPLPHPTEVVVLPGAGHAFANDTRPDAYRPEAAKAAWARMLGFLGEHLRG